MNSGNFFLDNDPSNAKIGAKLSQVQNGVERVIDYGSSTEEIIVQQIENCMK